MASFRRLLAHFLLALAPLAGAAQQAPVAPDAAELERRIAALEAEPPGAGGAELLTSYRAALAALERARELALRAAELERQAKEAPALSAAIREELARPAPSLEPPEGADLAQLARELEQAEADRVAAAALVERAERQAAERAERLQALPDEVARARQRVSALEESVAAAEASDPLGEARLAELGAELEAERAHLQALEAERAAWQARDELVALETRRARRRASRAEEVVASLRGLVSGARQAQAAAQAREAERQLRETTERVPALAAVAARNEALASLRSGSEGIPAQIDAAEEALRQALVQERAIGERFAATRRKIAIAGLTQGMGTLLRREHERLPSLARLRGESVARRAQLSRAQLLQIEVEEDPEAESGEQAARRILAEVRHGGEGLGDEQVSELVLSLVETGARLRSALAAETADLIDTLLEHERVHERLVAATAAYRSYIEERILWIRSSSALLPDPERSAEALRWLFDGSEWLREGRLLGTAEEIEPGEPVLLLLAIFGVLALRGRARRTLAETATAVRSYRTDRFTLTLRALLATLVLASPGPLALWLLGALLSAPLEQVPVADALGHAAEIVAPSYLALAFLRVAARAKGLGEAHLRWRAEGMRALRRGLRWFVPVVVPLMLAVFAFEEAGHAASDSAGRIAFVAYALCSAVFLFRLLHRETAVFADELERETLLTRTHGVWYTVAFASPAALAVAALAGYYYTALQLEARFRGSLGLAIALVLVNALLARWLFITRRRLAVEHARQRVAARVEKQDADAAARESGALVDEDAVDIPAMDAQTRQIFRTGVAVAALFGFFLIWSGAFPALRTLDRVHLWPELAIVGPEAEVEPARELLRSAANGGSGAADPASPAELAGTGAAALAGNAGAAEAPATEERPRPVAVVTLADLGLALVILGLMALAARNVPGLLEFTLLRRMPLDSGARFAFTTLFRYLILVVGVSAAFGAVGIGWNTIQWLAAALTFGLAFGLQEIFANFVSGIIILLERPVRVGDIVTVDGIEGRVTRLRMRATTILDWDRRELLIPNKQFITANVVNWTLTDPVTRLTIRVGIAYGSDTKLARELLLRVARSSPYAMSEPGPQAIFVAFGASSLDFELRVFMRDRDLWPTLIDQMHSGIDEAFRAAGIEIAFPQRDLHVRSAEGLRGLLGPDAAPPAPSASPAPQ